MSGALRLQRDGAVATLLIDQPTRRNAMTRAMWRALPGLVAEAAADDGIATLRVEGAGGHFCGGADISEFAETYATREATSAASTEIASAVEALAALPKPAVAVIRGACVGGGVALALACDLRFAATDARFAATPAKLGLIYSQADTTRLIPTLAASDSRGGFPDAAAM
jgi:enoyl-CoA hydratase/carnithine racemase